MGLVPGAADLPGQVPGLPVTVLGPAEVTPHPVHGAYLVERLRLRAPVAEFTVDAQRLPEHPGCVRVLPGHPPDDPQEAEGIGLAEAAAEIAVETEPILQRLRRSTVIPGRPADGAHIKQDAGLEGPVAEVAVYVQRFLPDPGRIQVMSGRPRIGPALADVTDAAAAHAASAGARERTVPALGQLSGVLLPHLRREEEEMMPLVSAPITEAEWRRWDQEYNLKPLRPLPLADTGLWVMDGLNPADRAQVTALVPPVPRWIITTFLSGRYRRAAYRRWQLPEHSGLKSPQSGQAGVTSAAAPEAVWAARPPRPKAPGSAAGTNPAGSAGAGRARSWPANRHGNWCTAPRAWRSVTPRSGGSCWSRRATAGR
jgi:hypothetical protein